MSARKQNDLDLRRN